MIDFYIFEHYNVSIKKRGVKMGFQENLRYYREKANLTPTEMAKYLNVAYNTYVGYEVRGREPKYDALCKIADLLNVSTDELLGRENNILGMNEDERLKKEINAILINEMFELYKIDTERIYFKVYTRNNICIMSMLKNKFVILLNQLNKVIKKDKQERFNNVLENLFIYDIFGWDEKDTSINFLNETFIEELNIYCVDDKKNNINDIDDIWE